MPHSSSSNSSWTGTFSGLPALTGPAMVASIPRMVSSTARRLNRVLRMTCPFLECGCRAGHSPPGDVSLAKSAVDVRDFEADELVVRLGGEVAEVEDFPERHTAPIHAQSCVAEANPVDDAVDGVGVLP